MPMRRATRKRLQALIEDPENDAVLVLNVQTALASSRRYRACGLRRHRCRAKTPRRIRKPVLTCWIGSDDPIDRIFRDAHLPHYSTEVDAVRGFFHLARRSELMQSLMTRPAALPDDFTGDAQAVRKLVEVARREGRNWLNPAETNAVLDAYAIPTVPLHKAADPKPRRRRPGNICKAVSRWRSKSCPPTFRTNPMSTACGSI